MNTLEKMKGIMLDVYSITDETREKVRNAFEVEQLIEILAREYPQMAQAICMLRVIEVLKQHKI
jgi:hypothetical protein